MKNSIRSIRQKKPTKETGKRNRVIHFGEKLSPTPLVELMYLQTKQQISPIEEKTLWKHLNI